MPFSLLLQGYPTTDIPVAHVQGPVLQGMFLQLIREVDPVVNQRLHEDNCYRPYTLSPLGLAHQAKHAREARFGKGFQGSGCPATRFFRRKPHAILRLRCCKTRCFQPLAATFLNGPNRPSG